MSLKDNKKKNIMFLFHDSPRTQNVRGECILNATINISYHLI